MAVEADDHGGFLRAVLARLPAHFVVLCLLVVGLAWFTQREARQRETVYAPLLSACLQIMQHQGPNR